MKEYFGASPKLQAAAFYLRYKIFVLEQNILPELEFDKLDTAKRQYVVFFEENLPIATVRYQKIDERTLNPDRLCVHPDFRKQGFGKKLLAQIEERAKKEGCHTSILSAELQAQRFYEKLDYRVSSAPFEEDGIICVKMKKDLIAE